jgi:hypothetical protein
MRKFKQMAAPKRLHILQAPRHTTVGVCGNTATAMRRLTNAAEQKRLHLLHDITLHNAQKG